MGFKDTVEQHPFWVLGATIALTAAATWSVADATGRKIVEGSIQQQHMQTELQTANATTERLKGELERWKARAISAEQTRRDDSTAIVQGSGREQQWQAYTARLRDSTTWYAKRANAFTYIDALAREKREVDDDAVYRESHGLAGAADQRKHSAELQARIIDLQQHSLGCS